MAVSSKAEALHLDGWEPRRGDDGVREDAAGNWTVELPRPRSRALSHGDRAVSSGSRLVRSVSALLIGLAAVSLGGAVYFSIPAGATAAGAAELGEIVVSSHPSGAAVRVDGVERGTTPVVLRVAAGRHQFEVVGANGVAQPVDTEVVAGRSVARHVELSTPASVATDGNLIVDTGDPAALLAIDGVPGGATALSFSRVPPGTHVVEVRYRGGPAVTRQVHVPAGETVSLVLAPAKRAAVPLATATPLAPVAPVPGWVRIQASFPVQVFERGQLVGSSATERLLLTPGPHTLELVNAELGYRRDVSTQVAAGKGADLAVETPHMPVSINALPWAQVIVDGRGRGDTPIANLMLPIGEHQVVLRHPELGEQVQTITVRTGGATRVSADLRR